MRSEIRCSFPDTMMRLRVDETKVCKAILGGCFVSRRGRLHMMRSAPGTSGSMKKIQRGHWELAWSPRHAHTNDEASAHQALVHPGHRSRADAQEEVDLEFQGFVARRFVWRIVMIFTHWTPSSGAPRCPAVKLGGQPGSMLRWNTRLSESYYDPERIADGKWRWVRTAASSLTRICKAPTHWQQSLVPIVGLCDMTWAHQENG